MQENNIFIPSKIRVGFDKRDDTYTGKLGYVIYYDAKNKIRKETSFLGWIDKSIPVLELDNTPQSGYVFNRGVQRNSSFSYSTAKIRVYDARDFEFEIDIGNLVEIMKHSDISHQEITEKCVFAWQGKELILLPINSEVYIKAQAFTQKLLNPLNVREFVPGQTFKNKAGEELVYLGDYVYYRLANVNPHRRENKIEQKKSKQSFFFNVKANEYVATNKNTMLEMIDDSIHHEYPDLVENLQIGLKKFQFTDFVQTPMSKSEVHEDILTFLKDMQNVLKKKIDKTDSYYYYQGAIQFPSHIYSRKRGFSNFHSHQYHSDKEQTITFSEYTDIIVSKNQGDTLSINYEENHTHSYYNRNDKSFKFSTVSVKSMNLSQLQDLATKIVEFMYSVGQDFYRIGFINSDNDIISLKHSNHNAIETWRYFKQWKSID